MKVYTDWRLPTVDELQTIVDRTGYNPAIDTRFFPDTQSSTYWSSTTYADYPNDAWLVSFCNGLVDYDGKDYYNYVRAVRGGRGKWDITIDKDACYTDNLDGTVTDNRTGLMWRKKTLGPYTWDKAHKLIEKMNNGEGIK